MSWIQVEREKLGLKKPTACDGPTSKYWQNVGDPSQIAIQFTAEYAVKYRVNKHGIAESTGSIETKELVGTKPAATKPAEEAVAPPDNSACRTC